MPRKKINEEDKVINRKPKHIHVRLSEHTFNKFSKYCIDRGISKQNFLEWVVNAVIIEDKRAVELIEDFHHAEKQDSDELFDFEIEQLQQLLEENE
jgi:hypothetical protein